MLFSGVGLMESVEIDVAEQGPEDKLKSGECRDKIIRKILKMELTASDLTWLAEGLMDIVRKNGGKRIPKEGPWAPSQYEFPSEQIAAKVVWNIHSATGREAVNSGKIVSVYK